MPSSTSVWSAICGIHLGDTKAVASMAGRPAAPSRSISSSLIAVGTSAFSFCSPSRGPISTMRTLPGRDILPMLQDAVALEDVGQLLAARQRRARGVLARHLHERGLDHRRLDRARHDDHAVGIAEHQVAGTYARAA